MLKFNCRYCKSQMTAYIEGELSLKARRRVARHLDNCPSCYARFTQQRERMEELKYQIPRIGQPNKPQLQKMWREIQIEMQLDTTRRKWEFNTPRYGLATLALVLALIIPLTMAHHNVDYSVPSQPAPAVGTDTPKLTLAGSSSGTDSVSVAFMTSDSSHHNVKLQNTPEAANAQ